MYLYNFIRTGAPEAFKRIVLTAALCGCANAFLVSQINSAAGETAAGHPLTVRSLALYVLSFAIFYVSNRSALLTANVTIEEMLRDLRMRLVDRIRKAELLQVDGLGRGDLFTKLIQETNHLSSTFPMLVNVCGQCVLLAFCLIYIGYLSKAALGMIFLASLAWWFTFTRLKRSLNLELRKVTAAQADMLDSVGHMVDGFKEIKVNRKKSDAVYETFSDVSHRLEEVTVGIGGTWIFLGTFNTFFLYLLLGVISYILPQYIAGYSLIVFKVAAATLFCVGPLNSLVTLGPSFMQANLGLEQLADLEAKLDSLEAGPDALDIQDRSDFQSLEYRGVTFSYRDANEKATFTCGPWDLSLKKGELLFLVGGNGSGKSTVLKLLTGLYPPDQGAILIDGLAVDGPTVLEHRSLFSVIFADFHLFDRLYGLENVAVEDVEKWIDRMELTGKVKYEDGRFTNLNLSTGQRKRLALIAAVLEDRPIYVFDEWASDQDVHFRKIFYEEILADLKARGKTIIAVTHDDRYWDVADRIVKMDLGQFSS